MHGITLIASGFLSLGIFGASQPEPAQPEPTPRTLATSVGPEQAIAIRLEQQRLAERVIPIVVIVEDAASYLDAIAAWDGMTRFPVLWDDGSVRSQEDIARFVRGFEPESVVRFTSSAEPWPRDRASRMRRIESALYQAVLTGGGAPSMRGFVERIREAKVPMVGVVLTDPDDAGWAGGLALAAGHVQPIGFVESPGRLNVRLEQDALATIETNARAFCDAVELSWAEPIDEVDAITLAFDCPVKAASGKGGNDVVATTDALGRLTPGSAQRWAWTGQLVCTDEARTVYQAMCSLFLAYHSAWIFDSYQSGTGWSQFDGTLASEKLIGSDWTTTVFDAPKQDLTTWRAASARGIDAGLILVNSMGNPDFFRLVNDDAYPGDVPLLRQPAGVHFVHSFSAARPASLDTVAGRWIEHGAYAYLGSVQEPGLSGFVATPIVAERLAGGFPFGCSVRHRSEPWKLAALGDPLATFHATGVRVEDACPLPGTRSVEESARSAVREEKFADAIRDFMLAGQTESAARLATGLLEEQSRAFDAALARASLLPLFLAGRPEHVFACFSKLDHQDQQDPLLLDALWHTGRLRVYADEAVLDLLRMHLRPGQEAEDAVELSDAWTHLRSGSSAVGMLQTVRQTTSNKRDHRRLDKKIKSLLGGG